MTLESLWVARGYTSHIKIHEDDLEVIRKKDLDDAIKSRLQYFEDNYPETYFIIVKRELRNLLKKETTEK